MNKQMLGYMAAWVLWVATRVVAWKLPWVLKMLPTPPMSMIMTMERHPKKRC
jgi:hypothetical protein